MGSHLTEHRDALRRTPFAYPLLVDALRAFSSALAKDAEVATAPEGREGATWNAANRSFWCGYWWPCSFGNLFAGANLMFEWRERLLEGSKGSVTWIPSGEESGYAAYVELRKGTRHDGKIIAILSLERFVEEGLTEEGVAALAARLEKTSVGVYDRSQLRGRDPNSQP